MENKEINIETKHFFTIGDIEYVVVFEELDNVFYKVENNELVRTTDEESKELKEKFRRDDGLIFYSQLANNIIDSNPYLAKKDVLYSLIDRIEKVVPEGCRNNLYRNLATLDIDYNIEDALKPRWFKKEGKSLGCYDTVNNIIEMNGVAFGRQGLSRKELTAEYLVTLTHELLHMASTKWNNEEEVVCGFVKEPSDTVKDANDGLNEGLTDTLAYTLIPQANKKGTAYFIECSIVEQLSLIIGADVLLDSYFANKGIEPLCYELNKIIPNNNYSHKLFRLIEFNFQLSKKENRGRQNVLASVQDSLLNYLDYKLENMTANSNFNPQDGAYLLETFEDRLLTPKKVDDAVTDAYNYVGIDQNVRKFNEIKERYSTYIYEDTEMDYNYSPSR